MTDEPLLPPDVEAGITNLKGVTEEEREEIRNLALKFRWKYPLLYQHERNH